MSISRRAIGCGKAAGAMLVRVDDAVVGLDDAGEEVERLELFEGSSAMLPW